MGWERVEEKSKKMREEFLTAHHLALLRSNSAAYVFYQYLSNTITRVNVIG